MHGHCFEQYAVFDQEAAESCPMCRQPWWHLRCCGDDAAAAVHMRHTECLVAMCDPQTALRDMVQGATPTLLGALQTPTADDVHDVIAEVVRIDSVFGLRVIADTCGIDVLRTTDERDAYAYGEFLNAGATALDYAACLDVPSALRWLLEHVPYTLDAVHDALQTAITFGSAVATRLILEARGNEIRLDFADDDGDGFLLAAMHTGDRECLALLFSHAGVATLGEFFARHPVRGDTDFVCEVLERTHDVALLRDVVAQLPFDASNALNRAISRWNDPEAIDLLLDPRSATLNCVPVQDWALPTVRLLLAHGIRVTKPDLVHGWRLSSQGSDILTLLVHTARGQADAADLLDASLVLQLAAAALCTDADLDRLLDEPTVVIDETTAVALVEACMHARLHHAPDVVAHPKVARVFPWDTWRVCIAPFTQLDMSSLTWLCTLVARGNADAPSWPTVLLPDVALVARCMPVTFELLSSMLQRACVKGDVGRFMRETMRCVDALVEYVTPEILQCRDKANGGTLLHIAAASCNALAVRVLLAADAKLAWVPDNNGNLPIFFAGTCRLLYEFRHVAARQYAHRDRAGNSLFGTLLHAKRPDVALMLFCDFVAPADRVAELCHESDDRWVAYDVVTHEDERIAHLARHIQTPVANAKGVSLLASVLSTDLLTRVQRLLAVPDAMRGFRLVDAFPVRTGITNFSRGLVEVRRAGYRFTDADRVAAEEEGFVLWDDDSELWK